MYTIRVATATDHMAIADVIARHDMVAPVFDTPSTWWVACDALQQICGTIGVEHGDDAWLLRSAVVDQHARGHSIGRALTRALIDSASQHGIRRIYCFSTDAGDFWQHMGFWEVPVAELLAALPNAPQVAQFDRLGWLPTEVAWRHDP